MKRSPRAISRDPVQHLEEQKEQLGATTVGVQSVFTYNLSECGEGPAGGACRKGRHVCFKANCFKLHSFLAKKMRCPRQD